jgi:hypothetical protein
MSMLVNFLLMCVSVLTLPIQNPEIANRVHVAFSRKVQVILAVVGTVMLTGFLGIHIWKDLSKSRAWYLHATPLWIFVMALASIVYFREVGRLRKRGVDVKALFSKLPPE